MFVTLEKWEIRCKKLVIYHINYSHISCPDNFTDIYMLSY